MNRAAHRVAPGEIEFRSRKRSGALGVSSGLSGSRVPELSGLSKLSKLPDVLRRLRRIGLLRQGGEAVESVKSVEKGRSSSRASETATTSAASMASRTLSLLLACAALFLSLLLPPVEVEAGSIGDKDTMIGSGYEPANDNNGCVSAGVFSTKLLTGICWDCVLPIIVGAVPIGGSGTSGVPDGAASSTLGSAMCMCYDNNGVPSIGIRTSLWEPYRLVEFERQPGCSSVLNGVRFPFDRLNQVQDRSQFTGMTQTHHTSLSKKHYHYYSFPIMTMLDMWLPRNCNPGFYMDLDVMYMSEIDPTWNYDELAFFTHPEAALVASPFGVLACIPDAILSQVNKPVKELFWCAGSWGVVFPASGHTHYTRDMLQSTSLMAVRVLYALHRRAMEYRTMGRDAMCNGALSAYIPKTQYRLSMFHPVAETSSNHALGESVLLWGVGRVIPMTGEDPVMLIWRWVDCCNTSTGT